MSKETYVYKIRPGYEIRADVYRPAVQTVPSPVLLWIHGGALIFGGRDSIHPQQRDRYTGSGYSVVSIDYRLAPETKLPSIIEDIQDAARWVREAGVELLQVDPDRLAVIGHSAGGYLALMAGFSLSPRPKALVSFYGYGDILGDWYTRPDPYYCKEPPVSIDDAYRALTSQDGNRFLFYLYCRQQGLWPKEVGGHDPKAEASFFRPYCPIQNLNAGYPPTLLLHGDQDTDVPYQQSVRMAEALDRLGVENRLITIPGGGHGFDEDISHPAVQTAFDTVLSFLGRHL